MCVCVCVCVGDVLAALNQSWVGSSLHGGSGGRSQLSSTDRTDRLRPAEQMAAEKENLLQG